MAGASKERSMEQTPTWAIAVVCFILLVASIIIEHLIHLLDKWLKKKHKHALSEALEKIKAELMLLGFISLILTVIQGYISEICIPKYAGLSWHPCRKDQEQDITKYYDTCAQDKTQLVSAKALHELHIFIFVLATFHVLFSITTLGLGTLKMRKWKAWEDETKSLEYQYYNDPERFRYARETSFGRRHLHFWSENPILLWIVCFFRQFLASITKVDYFALRHGFIMAHLSPNNEASFDFQKYISRSLEKDFKVVVGISPVIWLFAVLFLLSNTHGSYSYYWLPTIPLVITLLVGAKLQVIITQMGLRIKQRGDIIKGTPVVETGDHLFWFNRPGFLLFLINFILFQNAFQLAFFAFSTYKYGLPSCFHRGAADIAIRLSMGIIVQFICSYVTLPLYALVTQMGSTMKPEIFDDKVSSALRSWHHTAKKHAKEVRKSENTTPFSSRPGTPLHGTSPLHLLQGYKNSTNDDSLQATPRASDSDHEMWADEVHTSPQRNIDDHEDPSGSGKKDQIDHTGQVILQVLPSMSQVTPRQRTRSVREIDISPTDFSFNDPK